MASLTKLFKAFSPLERWQAVFLSVGVFCFKFSVESSTLTPFTINKLDMDHGVKSRGNTTYTRYGMFHAIALLFMVIGTSLMAPLVKRWGFRAVLVSFIFLKAFAAAGLLSMEAATGGKLKHSLETRPGPEDRTFYGSYSPYALIWFYCLAPLCSAVILNMKNIAPRRIVGLDPSKLQTLNATVMVVYHFAAIAGALFSVLVFIPRFGENFPISMAVFAGLAGFVWCFLKPLPATAVGSNDEPERKTGQLSKDRTSPTTDGSTHMAQMQSQHSKVLGKTANGMADFVPFKSLWRGARIIYRNKDANWLIIAAPLVQYGHATLEHILAPAIAGRGLGRTNLVQTIIAGSNVGECLGAFAAMFLLRYVPTPVPWVRLAVITNMFVWFFCIWSPDVIGSSRSSLAWVAASIYMPIGAAWSAAAVAINSYLQTLFSDETADGTDELPPLSCVVSFLFVVETVISGGMNPLLGLCIDKVVNAKNIRVAFLGIGGGQYTFIMFVVLASTFITPGSRKLNPALPDYVHKEETVAE